MERALQTLKSLNKVTEKNIMDNYGNKTFWGKKFKTLYANLTLWIITVFVESDLIE